jgi:hypothetical protein
MTFGGDYGIKEGYDTLLSAGGIESMILSACTKSIILSTPPRVSVRVCPCAESIILSSGGVESMILSAHTLG